MDILRVRTWAPRYIHTQYVRSTCNALLAVGVSEDIHGMNVPCTLARELITIRSTRDRCMKDVDCTSTSSCLQNTCHMYGT